MKLKLRNIKILSGGQQIKNMILRKQNPFERVIPRDELIAIFSKARKYAERRKRSFNKLNSQLILSLNRGYYDIVLTPKQQIIKFVDNFANSIKEYKNKNDIKTLEKVKRMCLQEGLDYEAVNAVKGKENLLFVFFPNSDFIDFRGEEDGKTTTYYVPLNKLSDQLDSKNIRNLIVPCDSIEGLRLEIIRSLNNKKIKPIELFETLGKIISKENEKQP